MKKKLVITSAITAAIMAAGAVGGTIAYFSTSNETEVNITSAKINVSSVVSDLKTYSLEQEQNPAGTFENGGEASITGNVVTLDRMSPGDKATFKIAITCDNNIKIKYRVAFNKSGDLAPALVANVSGGAADWTLVEPSETPSVINLDASIELPISTGIEYNDKQGQVRIVVEAVQGNMPQAVSSAAELEDAIAAIPAEGGEVSLYVEDDITLTQIIAIPSNSQVNLYGDGDTTITNAPGASRVINFNNAENSTLTISGLDLHQGSTGDPNYERTITIGSTSNCTLNVYDCEITNDSHYPINVTSSNTNVTINVEDSVLDGYCAINIWAPGTVVNVKNSTLKGTNVSSGASNAFSVMVFNQGATNCGLNLNNCVVESRQTGDQFESFLSLRAAGTQITSQNTVYKYYRLGASQPEVYNSLEEVCDYNSFMFKYDAVNSSYGFELKAVAYQDGGAALTYPLIDMSGSLSLYEEADIEDISEYIYGAIAEVRQVKLGANGYYSYNCLINSKAFLMACLLILE